MQALKEKWLVVDEVERERTQRQVYAVRLAGPVPEKPLRLSPVAKRILEALGAEGVGGGPSRTSSYRSSGSCRPQETECFRPRRTCAFKGRTPFGPTNAEASAFGGGWAEAGSTLVLTSAQSTVLDDLTKQLGSGQFQTVLLHGVTGSGKTEVYLRLIARCLEIGRTALMLVPEIALTPSVQAQFLARFGSNVALLHSALSENERHEEWWRIRRGEAQGGAGNTLGDIRSPREPGSGDHR